MTAEKAKKSVISLYDDIVFHNRNSVSIIKKLVGSLHKQVLVSMYFDNDGNHEYNL